MITEELKKRIDEIEPDVQSVIYQTGFEAGQFHNRPAPETLQRLKAVENKLDKLDAIHQCLFGYERTEGLVAKIDKVIEQTHKRLETLETAEAEKKGSITVLKSTVGVLISLIITVGGYFVVKFDTIREQVNVLVDRSNIGR